MTQEFLKRLDPHLPFYYHTSAHNHFYEGLLPSFDEKSKKAKRKRIPRHKLLGANERVTVAIYSNSSVCAKFHNVPEELPHHPEQVICFYMSMHMLTKEKIITNHRKLLAWLRNTVGDQSSFLVIIIPAYRPDFL